MPRGYDDCQHASGTGVEENLSPEDEEMLKEAVRITCQMFEDGREENDEDEETSIRISDR